MKVTLPSKVLSISMYVQHLIVLCPFVFKILSGNKILTSIKSYNSVTKVKSMRRSKPKIDLININGYANFANIISSCSQDIKRKEL